MLSFDAKGISLHKNNKFVQHLTWNKVFCN